MTKVFIVRNLEPNNCGQDDEHFVYYWYTVASSFAKALDLFYPTENRGNLFQRYTREFKGELDNPPIYRVVELEFVECVPKKFNPDDEVLF